MADEKKSAAAVAAYECNICLDQVYGPVVTLCGHLYCWGCLFEWLKSHDICPVCKAGVTQENVIPIYCRGSENVDPRTVSRGIPNRPAGHRPEPQHRSRRGNLPDEAGAAGDVFPSLFGLQFHIATNNATAVDVAELDGRTILSRALLLLGTSVLISLLFF